MNPAGEPPPRRRRWAIPVLGLVGLLVAVATWLLPDPGGKLCSLVGDRLSGCSDIPAGYVGRWTGTMRAVDYGLIFSPSRKEFPSTLTIDRGRVGEGIVAREVGDESQPETACVQEWRLTAARADMLSFHVDETYPLDPAKMSQGGALRRCTPDLSVTVKLTEQGTLQVEVMAGPNTSPLVVPPGLRLFHGTLSRAEAAT